MATVGRGADQYTVRFPDGLRDRVKEAAEANGRSMNAEIVSTLEEKYPAPISDEELKKLLVAASGLLDAIEKISSPDAKVIEGAAVLRAYLKEAERRASSGSSSEERQRVYDEAHLVFDRIADGMERALNASDEGRRSEPSDDT